MLALNNVNVLENQKSPQKSRDISDWPLLDSRGNSLDELGPASTAKRNPPDQNKVRFRERTPETDDELAEARAIADGLGGQRAPRKRVTLSDTDDDEDFDEDDDGLDEVIQNKMRTERNYMYPEHEPGKSNPAKPPMLKFKASLFSRNVLVVNRALKRLSIRPKNNDDADASEDEGTVDL